MEGNLKAAKEADVSLLNEDIREAYQLFYKSGIGTKRRKQQVLPTQR